jgi:DinB superfamily
MREVTFAVTTTLKGSLMGLKTLPDGGVQEIVSVTEEQRPQDGPAAPSMVSVLRQGGRRVAGYIPWINYYDIDEAARQEPDAWRVIEPPQPYAEEVDWKPYGLRTGGRAGSIELAGLLADLAQTPTKMRRTVAIMGEDSNRAPEPGEWSVAEAALHLIAADSIMAPRVYQILAQPGVTLPDMDVTEVTRVLARAQVPLQDRLAAFEARRKEWIAMLDQITGAELEHSGEHTRDGTITILDICRNLVAHEMEHKKQVEAIATALGYTLG